ncbi:hypothetical protein RJT34_04423 [Clitoria ternatea]|uniref:Uncharacterized protein n=1 Tax=Clitoria ternatea TaxID=43366 RepID=A0AAN9Q649_CLITE
MGKESCPFLLSFQVKGKVPTGDAGILCACVELIHRFLLHLVLSASAPKAPQIQNMAFLETTTVVNGDTEGEEVGLVMMKGKKRYSDGNGESQKTWC